MTAKSNSPPVYAQADLLDDASYYQSSSGGNNYYTVEATSASEPPRLSSATPVRRDPPPMAAAPQPANSIDLMDNGRSDPYNRASYQYEHYNPASSSRAMTPHAGSQMDYFDDENMNYPDPAAAATVNVPNISQMKRNRRIAASTTGVALGITGLVVAGPIGAAVLGVGGGYTVKAIGKRRERRKTRKYQEQMAHAGAVSSDLVYSGDSSGYGSNSDLASPPPQARATIREIPAESAHFS